MASVKIIRGMTETGQPGQLTNCYLPTVDTLIAALVQVFKFTDLEYWNSLLLLNKK